MVTKQVLILASVASMIDQFNMPNIKLLKQMGYEVHVACNFVEGNTCSDEQITILKNNLIDLNVQFHQIDFKRNVMRLADSIKAYRQVHKLANDNNYKFIHCHSPIGGVVGRLVGKATKTKVIYTAHGFHFYKGAPLKNWLIYYPIEKWLSKYTDVLITINKEDYERAKKKFKAKTVERVPGVGIDVKKFNSVEVDRKAKLREIGIPEDSFVILSVGELNKNKNHEVIIKAIAKISNSQIHYVICGQGPLKNNLTELVKRLNLINQVHLLGFRDDVTSIYKICDIFAFPSLREGLGLSALEAMASELPIITSNVHGIVDYSINGLTGYSSEPNNVDAFSEAIKNLMNNKDIIEEIGRGNYERVRLFDVNIVIKKMRDIYNSKIINLG